MKIFRPKYLYLLLSFTTVTAVSQNIKTEKTFKTNKDVRVIVDARHTNLAVETWDKNEVQVRAYLDGEFTAGEAKNLLENWKLETSGEGAEVRIISGGGVSRTPELDMAALNESMAHLHKLIEPVMTEMVKPMMENLEKNPPLPPDFVAKIGKLNFDYEAYQKEGEKYLERWEKQIEMNFGKEFEASMEKWAAQFEKNAAAWEKNMEKEMSDKEKQIEKSMEEWAEKFSAEMEEWGKQFSEEEKPANNTMKKGMIKTSSKAVRNIKIMIPRNAVLNLNVRHGEVNLGERTTDLKANLSHSKLSGKIIDGEKTDVQASYTPVSVAQWNYGVLNTSFVSNCNITKAKSIKLVSNSSDVNIQELEDTGILSGTFGSLKIGKISPGFSTLNISAKNSEVQFTLPDSALLFTYNGTNSNVKYPKTSTVKANTSYDKEMLNGYYKSGNTGKQVTINAAFSEVLIK